MISLLCFIETADYELAYDECLIFLGESVGKSLLCKKCVIIENLLSFFGSLESCILK